MQMNNTFITSLRFGNYFSDLTLQSNLRTIYCPKSSSQMTLQAPDAVAPDMQSVISVCPANFSRKTKTTLPYTLQPLLLLLPLQSRLLQPCSLYLLAIVLALKGLKLLLGSLYLQTASSETSSAECSAFLLLSNFSVKLDTFRFL